MAQLNPYLFFKGNCREAMEFYQACLGGKLDLMKAGDSPMGSEMSAEAKEQIMHSALVKDNWMLMASDWISEDETQNGTMMRVCLSGPDKEEIKGYFAKLSEGADVKTPLKDEYFGLYGDLVDKFGVHWMFQGGEM